MAEGAFQAAIKAEGLSAHITTDSAGTYGYHVGSSPDPRAIETARKNHVDISQQRSRKVRNSDFDEFDYILAMDNNNYQDLLGHCPPTHTSRLHMFLNFAPHLPLDEMPDPYYGPANMFDTCFTAAAEAAKGLLNHIKETDL